MVEAPAPDAPVGEPAPSAPVGEAAPDTVRTSERGGVIRHEFLQTDTAAKTETPAPEQKTEPKADAEAPKGDTTPPAEPAALSDDEFKRIEKDPRFTARVEQLANNRVGNVVQRERDKIRSETLEQYRKEQAAWQAADEAYQLLSSRGRDAFMREYNQTERQAVEWEANYLREREQRDAAPAPNSQAIETIRADFNTGAVSEMKAAMTTLLPFYGELPEETRKVIDGLAFNPEGNWLEDAFTALVKGIAARDDKVKRDHEAALREARTAGANSALAAREEGSPVIVEAKPNDMAAMSNHELNAAFNRGDLTREQFNAENRRRGIDW